MANRRRFGQIGVRAALLGRWIAAGLGIQATVPRHQSEASGLPSRAAAPVGRWTQLGGPEEADVTALALSPQFGVDGMAFAGTAQGMLFATSDGGETWRYLRQVGQDVAGLVVSPAFAADHTVIAAEPGKL